ncbi:MAG TPA: hypothetical protein VJ873_06025, partial [bacterium]|nr:hypothetical protein [bacterium]
SLSDGIVKTNPSNGMVYVATGNGFFRGPRGGGITQVLAVPVLGLDVIPTQPNNVYISERNGIYISTNSGQSFTALGNTGLPTTDTPGLRNLKVSPANPQNMLVDDDRGSYSLQRHYYSNNGGNSWSLCTLNSTQAFLPTNPREWLFAWSPSNGNQAWAFGGDFISQTTDAGAHFSWSNNGFNGFTCTGYFNFNPFYPDLLLLTSQDGNSALTKNINGNPTAWQYLDVSGQGWGGFTYAGYALNPNVLVAGNAQTWAAPATLMISTNGGGLWANLAVLGNKTQAVCGDPTIPSVAFWDNYRTSDGGNTWQAMAADAVFTFNSNPGGNHELYGSSGPTVLKSTNHGLTWNFVALLPNIVMDVACDWKNGQLYIATGDLYTCSLSGTQLQMIDSRLEADNRGHKGAYSVAVDPVDPDVAYAAWTGNNYISSQAVRRSLDGGQTWTPLTLQPGDTGPDGGLESECVRVDPVTRYLFSADSCFGLWKYPPPSTAIPAGPATSTAPFPFPNPVRSPDTSIQVQLAFNNNVPNASLAVFTVAFRKVKELPLGDMNAGVTTVTLPLTDGRNTPLANGLYYLVIRPSPGTGVGKLLILR